MIEYLNGDLLQTNVDIIAHQCNCLGVMGAGIALQIKNKYPGVFTEYYNFCKTHKQLLGECQLVKIGNNKYVANLFGQYNIYPYNIRHTDYDALEQSLKFLKLWCISNNLKTIGIPCYIGCGLAGGDWDNVVHPMLKNIFETDNNVILKIVKYV